jgi:hypothetical protein
VDAPQSLNGYSYAGSNPVTSADPTGLCADIDCPTRPGPGYENTTPGHTPGPPKKSANTIYAENGESYDGTAKSSGQTMWNDDGQVLACAYNHCIGNVGKDVIEEKTTNFLLSLAPDGPLIDLLQGQVDNAHDEIVYGCEKDEPGVCAAPKGGTFDIGIGTALVGRAATNATSKLLAARVEMLFAKGIAGQKRSALAGMLELEGQAPRLLLATSGKHQQAGLVPLVGTKGNPSRYPATSTGNNSRLNDTEYKMLTYVANQLGGPSDIKGSLTLHSSQQACTSCTQVIGRFMQEFPNIRINYTSGRP